MSGMLTMRGSASDVKKEGVTFQNKTGSPETKDNASPLTDTPWCDMVVVSEIDDVPR